jgi:precorrin-3B C17-methyltransferase
MTGSLHIVGLGPGDRRHRTPAAAAAIAAAEVIVGYGPYVEQCADLIEPHHEVVRGAMGEEEARADEALARAEGGARVALVSSGDAGVYGMAARTLERAAATPAARRPRIEVVPGLTVALAAGALLGAPLADDWATISLSDLRLPWPRVLARLAALAGSGVALAIYNPRSRGRTARFPEALELLRERRGAETPVAIVRDVARDGEAVERTTLGELDEAAVSMRTILLVAGETGRYAGPWLVADRSLLEAAEAGR